MNRPDAVPHGTSVSPGTPLIPGRISISAAEDAELESILEGSVRRRQGHLHPLYAYVAPQRGIGTSIADLCEMADFSVDDGPMLGTVEIEIGGDLLADHSYQVEGEVVDMVRKQSRRLGAFDLLTFRERLVNVGGTAVSTVTTSFVLPRGSGSSKSEHSSSQPSGRGSAEPEAGGLLPALQIDPVRSEAMKRMAVILDDPNPIHLDGEAVRRLGLGDRPINQGPTGCGYILNMLSAAFPAGILRHLKVRFLANVYALDSVRAGGRVVGTRDVAGDESVDCAVWLDVDGGGRAIEGTAVVRLGTQP